MLAETNGTVVHITQRGLVYWGDVVDVRGITGWTDTLAWWKGNHDPSYDPPDHLVNITKYERFLVTEDMEGGYWFQWYGETERNPVVVFQVVPRKRPAPTPTKPVTAPTQPATAVVSWTQPKQIADLIVARWDSVEYPVKRCMIWLLGPSLSVMGNITENSFILSNTDLKAGTYSMIIQYPDGNGVFEIFRDSDASYINSTWKDVPSLWYEPLQASIIKDKLMGMYNDTAHFHGRIEEKRILIEEQYVDVTSLDETYNRSLIISGITNLGKGATITLIFDEDKNVETSDREKNTFTAKVIGDNKGAYRIWQGTLMVNLARQTVGDHFISIYTPDGHKATVSFYVMEAFEPFKVPVAHIRYINYSPFIPTPTPIIVEREVVRTVTQVIEKQVIVNITPDYDKLNAMQWANLQGAIIHWLIVGTVGVAGIYVVVTVARFLRRRQVGKKEELDIWREEW